METGRKSNAASLETKRALAAALKRRMAKKPLDKITIQELTDLCGMRRQSFYYHFEDIYGLLRWMFQEEAVSLLHEREGALLWQEGLLQLFRYLQENRAVCLCALNSGGREDLRRFFGEDIDSVIRRTIEQVAQEIGWPGEEDAPGDLDLLTRFYVAALAGVAERWLLGEIDRTPEDLIAFVDEILNDHIRGAAARAAERGRREPPPDRTGPAEENRQSLS